MGKLMRSNKKYREKDAVKNVINYVTRHNSRKSDEDLIGYGGCGVSSDDPDKMCQQMQQVQSAYDLKEGKRQIFQTTYSMSREEVAAMGDNKETLLEYASDCAEHYFRMGHQVVYAVHKNQEGDGTGAYMHIHFAVCSVDYENGRMYNESFRVNDSNERMFDKYQKKYRV